MQLKISERFALLDILPNTGDFHSLKVRRQLIEALSLDEKEIKEWGVVSESSDKGFMLQWATNGETDISISDMQEGMIVTALKRLDQQKMLEEKHMGVYEKFVMGGDNGKAESGREVSVPADQAR